MCAIPGRCHLGVCRADDTACRRISAATLDPSGSPPPWPVGLGDAVSPSAIPEWRTRRCLLPGGEQGTYPLEDPLRKGGLGHKRKLKRFPLTR